MSRSLCLFAGNATAPNVRLLVENICNILGSQFNLHLVSTQRDSLDDKIISNYDIFGDGLSLDIRGEILALKKYFQSHNPAVGVQLTRPPIHGSLVGLLSKYYGVPFVYRYAGDRFISYKVSKGIDSITHFGLSNVVGKIPFKIADQHIVMGPNGRDRLVNLGADPESVVILPPSVDPTRFHNVKSTNSIDVPQDHHVAMFLGRFTRLKGIETLERTLPTILRKRPDLHFVLVGEDDQVLSVPDQFADRVIEIGTVPPREIPSYLSRADLLVHPSLIEGVPRAILEALCAGTPVVARDVGDVSYVTKNIFQTEEEFINMVTRFECLPLDNIKRFQIDHLTQSYVDFFKKFVE